MRDIKIIINDDGYASSYEKFIGIQNENEATRLVFDLPDIYKKDGSYQYVAFTLPDGTIKVRRLVDYACIIDSEITSQRGVILISVIIKSVENVLDIETGFIMSSQPISGYIKKTILEETGTNSIDKNVRIYLDEFDALLMEIRATDKRLASILDSDPSKYAEIIDARGGYTVLKNRLDSMRESITDNSNDIKCNTKDIESNYITLLTKINAVASGSPLKANSISEMTDKTRIYVNITDGKWYYHNGTSWVVGDVYQSTVCDDSLSKTSTNAVQNKVVTSTVNDIFDLISAKPITFVKDYNITIGDAQIGDTINLTPSSVDGWYYAIVDCEESDTFLISGHCGNNPRLFAFLDSNNKLLEKSTNSVTETNLLLIAPKNASKLILNTNDLKTSYKGLSLNNLLSNNDSKIYDGVIKYVSTLKKGGITTNVETGTEVNLTVDSNNGAIIHTVIECEENDTFLISGSGGSNPRLYAFLDEDNKLINNAPANLSGDFKVIAPKNAVKLVVNMNSSTINRVINKYSSKNINNMYNDIDKLNKDTLSIQNGYGFNYANEKKHGSIPTGNISVGAVVNIESINDTNPRVFHVVLDCNENDKFKVTGECYVGPRLWAFLDSNNKLLSHSNPGIQGTYEIIAPKNAKKVIFNSSDYNEFSVYKYNDKNLEYLSSIITNITTNHNVLDNILSGNIKTGVNIGEIINTTPEPISGYGYVIVECEENDKFKIKGTGGLNPRLWAFVDENNVLLKVSNSYLSADTTIVAPNRAKKLIANFNLGATPINESYLYNLKESIPSCEMRLDVLENKVNNYSKEKIYTLGEDSIASFIRGINFSNELKNTLTDFKKPGDLMVHVSTFAIINDIIYATYYANTRSSEEKPNEHTARFVFCPINNMNNKTFIDLQDVGEIFDGKTVTAIYDTILLRKDDDTLFLMWTASLNNIYYRLYRTYKISTGAMSDIMVNNFKVGNDIATFSIDGMKNTLNNNNIKYKPLDGDIGIMQKLSSRVENDITYYYTGAYVGAFNCIIKSSDLVTWEYVSQPDFDNESQWENAVYVIDNKVYYFVRQFSNNNDGFLTYYDLLTNTWAKPVMIYDTQSRGDFFEYRGNLYLVHAPKDRNHISIMLIDRNILNRSVEIQTAKIPDYFYPYVQVYNNELYMSFTNSRSHIYLSKFTINNISNDTIINKFKDLFLS